jgi:hypothetical protein
MALSVLRGALSAEPVDFTATRTFLVGCVQVALAAVAFGVIFWLVAAFRLATLDPTPESAVLSVLLGVVPGAVLGAGVPCLLQYRSSLGRLGARPGARVVGPAATFGTYALLFGYDPVSSVLYAFVYLAGRTVVLVGIYGGSRIGGALA